MSENRLKKCLESIKDINYLSESKCSAEELGQILKLLKNIEYQDNPDGFCFYQNDILIVEHFEFDCSKNTRKGSDARKELAKVAEESSVHHNKNLEISKESTIRGKLETSRSIENYINNAIAAFNNHYNKIGQYKKNLTEQEIITGDKNVKTAFFIENTTVLHCMTTNGERVELCLCDKFLDAFENAVNLDYVFSFSSSGNETFCWFLSHANFNSYRRNQIQTCKIQLIDSTPHFIDFCCVIPEK